jgi:ElaB/YqjD/DUF883 family membrane-anchored ribosome-binding protein
VNVDDCGHETILLVLRSTGALPLARALGNSSRGNGTPPPRYGLLNQSLKLRNDTMTDFRQETDADLETPPADAEFQLAEPLKDAGVDFTPDEAPPAAGAAQTIKDGGNKLVGQATDHARAFADQGKAAAGDKLDQFARMLSDAAATVDDKLGSQYGQYARSAADQVAGFSDTIRNKDVDDLVEDVRGFVRASPAAAIGVAAAIGFAIARVVQSGLEANDAANGNDRA